MAKSSRKTRTKRQWTWIIAAALLLVLNVGLAANLLLSSESRRMAALQEGQRVEFSPQEGEVRGTLHRLADLAPQPKAPTTQEATAPTPLSPMPEVAEDPSSPPITAEVDVPPSPLPGDETEIEVADVPPAETPEAQPQSQPTQTPLSPDAAEPPVTTTSNAGSGLDPVQVRTPNGVVPRIAKNGQVPWKFYARNTASASGSGPRIAIVLTGLGLGSLTTEAALALPSDVTLSFSPYSRDSEKWITRAQSAGHEIMLDLPTETSRYPAMDPGPLGILNKNTSSEIYEKLLSIMEKASDYVGLVLPIDETISTNEAVINALVTDVSKHGLMLIGSGETSREFSQATRNATQPVLFADVVLDERITQTHITQQLNALEAVAAKQGFAIAVGRSFPVTVELVGEWARTSGERGMTIVPLTTLAK